jgi:hypothetical protein
MFQQVAPVIELDLATWRVWLRVREDMPYETKQKRATPCRLTLALSGRPAAPKARGRPRWL